MLRSHMMSKKLTLESFRVVNLFDPMRRLASSRLSPLYLYVVHAGMPRSTKNMAEK